MPICHLVFENTAAKTHMLNLETRSECGRKKEAILSNSAATGQGSKNPIRM